MFRTPKTVTEVGRFIADRILPTGPATRALVTRDGHGYDTRNMPRLRSAAAAIGLAILAPARDWDPPSRPAAADPPTSRALHLLPLPRHVEPGRGRFGVDAAFSVALQGHTEPRLEKAAERFLRRLADATGLPIRATVAAAAPASLTIACARPGEPVQSPSEIESYSLRVRPDGIRIESDTTVGAIRGLETLLQLVTPDASGFAAPEIEIRDAPRFAWRGLMIDVARRWQPVDILKRNLDAMAAVKLNVLHLHLSDDHGFRVESLRFTKLHELGSGGHYYTQAQIRDLVGFARERGIRVVPEFDMPGHCAAWLVGYPELAVGPGPFEIATTFDTRRVCFDPTSEKVYAWLSDFVAEMATLFPDAYWHSGGDEVDGEVWTRDAFIHGFMRARNWSGPQDIQAYFSGRLAEILAANGKKMVGWEEILPAGHVIQSYKSPTAHLDAARAGGVGLSSFGWYLDDMEPAEAYYRNKSLDEPAQGRLLGGEACLWCELVSSENIDARIWPRAAAIAERLWSSAQTTSVPDLYRRLARLSRMHLEGPRRMLERMTSPPFFEPLATLAEILEPMSAGHRLRARNYDVATPLNRVVDAVRPDSERARNFEAWVDELILDVPNFARHRYEIRDWLMRWKTNHEKLLPAMRESFILAEIEAVSAETSALAMAGLRALDCIVYRAPPPEAWLKEERSRARRLRKHPTGEVRIAIVRAVEKLLEAAGSVE